MTDPTDPSDPPVKPFDPSESALVRQEEALVDHLADKPGAQAAGNAALHVLAPQFEKGMSQLLTDLDAEAAADKKMLADMPAALHDHGPLELGNVDLTALRAADQQFDDEAFMVMARETFVKVRDARSLDDPTDSDALLSPAMQSDLQNAIAGDVASHRHHLLPELEIMKAQIGAATVADGRQHVTVRFHLSGEELDRDGAGNVVAGDATLRQWDEDWCFERDPSIDTSQNDEQHILAYHGWMVAHRGWVVTSIERVI